MKENFLVLLNLTLGNMVTIFRNQTYFYKEIFFFINMEFVISANFLVNVNSTPKMRKVKSLKINALKALIF